VPLQDSKLEVRGKSKWSIYELGKEVKGRDKGCQGGTFEEKGQWKKEDEEEEREKLGMNLLGRSLFEREKEGTKI
jgi:hypothetical protein